MPKCGRYPTNQIEEAICRVDLVGLPPVNRELGTRLHAELQAEFPQLHELRQITVTFGSTIGHSDQYQGFKVEGEGRSIEISHKALVVRKLKPYGSWSQLSDWAILALGLLVTEVSDLRFSRVAARYVNRFSLAEGSRLEDYFRTYPTLGEIHGALGNFRFRAEIHQKGIGGPVLILQQGMAPVVTPGSVSIILDLDYQYPVEVPGGVELLRELLTEVHDGLNDSFDACLTDQLRDEFLGGRRQ